MTTERKELLEKVNSLIDKRKKELLNKLQCVHEVDDGLTRILGPQTKMYVESNHFKGRAIENTRTITTNYK